MNYSADMKIHIEGSPDEPFMEDSSRELTKVSVEYKDGKWIMVSSEDGSSATDSCRRVFFCLSTYPIGKV